MPRICMAAHVLFNLLTPAPVLRLCANPQESDEAGNEAPFATECAQAGFAGHEQVAEE